MPNLIKAIQSLQLFNPKGGETVVHKPSKSKSVAGRKSFSRPAVKQYSILNRGWKAAAPGKTQRRRHSAERQLDSSEFSSPIGSPSGWSLEVGPDDPQSFSNEPFSKRNPSFDGYTSFKDHPSSGKHRSTKEYPSLGNHSPYEEDSLFEDSLFEDNPFFQEPPTSFDIHPCYRGNPPFDMPPSYRSICSDSYYSTDSNLEPSNDETASKDDLPSLSEMGELVAKFAPVECGLHSRHPTGAGTAEESLRVRQRRRLSRSTTYHSDDVDSFTGETLSTKERKPQLLERRHESPHRGRPETSPQDHRARVEMRRDKPAQIVPKENTPETPTHRNKRGHELVTHKSSARARTPSHPPKLSYHKNKRGHLFLARKPPARTRTTPRHHPDKHHPPLKNPHPQTSTHRRRHARRELLPTRNLPPRSRTHTEHLRRQKLDERYRMRVDGRMERGGGGGWKAVVLEMKGVVSGE